MASQKTSSLGSSIKSLTSEATLSVELSVPLKALAGSPSCSLSISILEHPLMIFQPQESILPVFTLDSMTGSLDSRATMKDPLP